MSAIVAPAQQHGATGTTCPAPPQHGARPAQDQNPVISGRDERLLGRILIEDGAVEARNLLRALIMRQRQDVPLGDILITRGWVEETALTRALSRQWRSSVIDLSRFPADPRLIDQVGADFCLETGVIPWRRTGGVTYVTTSRPDRFSDHEPRLRALFGEIRMLLCSETRGRNTVLENRRNTLARHAETRVPLDESCRKRLQGFGGIFVASALIGLVCGLALAPFTTLALLTLWATLTLVATSGLKLAAFMTLLRARAEDAARRPRIPFARERPVEMTGPLPVISVLVPLFAEADIADRLIGRLSRLTYPRELTDLILVIEETDRVTCEALDSTRLPRWIRVVKVPDGPIKTKPRALNYALNFCRGRIIGVWDAEDRPEPDQLHKVARRFHFAPPDVACLQGILDYYNPGTNWLARCFTIEYAAWFRANLPGIARMGLVVPLGGTTLFFRRDVLESLGGWDAWNVTEDADLGLRLARHGWRTEMLDTVTHEEANCRPLPWIKQRSRWLKGYAMTWAVHMRNPVRLWRDLGTRRFVGVQIQFLGTISQYLLVPVLWSFWLLSLGLPHPLAPSLATLWDGAAIPALFGLFVASELLSIAIAIWALRQAGHRQLIPWVPSLHFYFPLGCLAGWKAIWEIVTRPFYWDKTAHGIFDAAPETEAEEDAAALLPGRTVPLLTPRTGPDHAAAGTEVRIEMLGRIR